MSIERTYYCDADGCEHNARTATQPPYLPVGVIEVRDWTHAIERRDPMHFCSWDCVLKYGATIPPVTVIPWDPPASIDDGGPE